MSTDLILQIGGLVCFGLATVGAAKPYLGVPAYINTTALGLFLWLLSVGV